MKAKDLKIDLIEIEKEKKENLKERLQFIKFWTDYIKSHSDQDWSRLQNKIINSQINNSKNKIQISKIDK